MIPYRWLAPTPHMSDLQGSGFVVPRSSSGGEIVKRSLHELQRAEEIESLRTARHQGVERHAVVDRLRDHQAHCRMNGLLRANREPFQM